MPRIPTAAALAATLALCSPSSLAAESEPSAASATPVAGKKMVLPFVEDDYTRALAEARARRLPIFVETWAPW